MKKYILSIFIIVSFFSCSKTENPSEIRSEVPTIITKEITSISRDRAVCGGQIISDGGLPIKTAGLCWSTNPVPTVNDIKSMEWWVVATFQKSFITAISDLKYSTVYYVRAYATNEEGTGYGKVLSFTTSPLEKPTVETNIAENITPSTAVSGGIVCDDGGLPIIAKGVCWGTLINPTIEDNKSLAGPGSENFTSKITGLSENTLYFTRAYASNSMGIAYGSVVPFRTAAVIPISEGTVTDIDGNVYNYITIGAQKWMIENLKTTKYSNGDPIPNVSDQGEWYILKTGAYCNFRNNPDTAIIYGRLYNWYAVNDSRKLAPSGWHVATDSDWIRLINYVGGFNIAGEKLKEAGYLHWKPTHSNNYATNETGFTALPGGIRADAQFGEVGYSSTWWTATEYNAGHSISVGMSSENNTIGLSGFCSKRSGNYIRCIKD